MLPEQFKSLKILSDCPVCHQKHFPADIQLIEERADGELLHVRCKTCKSCIVVLVSLGSQGLNLVGVLTDLGSEEVKKVHARGPLLADDILRLHEKLQDKDFIKIFY